MRAPPIDAGDGGGENDETEQRDPGHLRIEADPIDIDTKFAGRIAEMFVDEGDMGSKAARSWPGWTPRTSRRSSRSEAQIQEAQHRLDEANANVDLTR
jgi:HlyD family secretion protein